MNNIPQNIAIEQIKQKIAEVINHGLTEYQIPLCVMDYLVKDIYSEVHTQAILEYEQTVRELKKQQETEKSEN